MNFDKRKKDILKVLATATIAMKANVIHHVLIQIDSEVTIVSVGRNLGLMSKRGWVVDLTGGIPGTPGQWQITDLGRAVINNPVQPAAPARGHAALVQEVKRLKDVISDNNTDNDAKVRSLEASYGDLEDRFGKMIHECNVMARQYEELRKDLNETDQFGRTHSHKSSLTTMTHEAKQGGAKQILISL
jgi:hypothetical protein